MIFGLGFFPNTLLFLLFLVIYVSVVYFVWGLFLVFWFLLKTLTAHVLLSTNYNFHILYIARKTLCVILCHDLKNKFQKTPHQLLNNF